MADIDQALWTDGYDDAVTVNQRALIHKVLARYSGESVVFRELLQNADDASASCVEIRYHSEATASTSASASASGSGSLAKSSNEGSGVVGTVVGGRFPDLRRTNVTKVVVRNDGIVFRDEDWGRLKKIAEGNPDPTKIGAFGVGFYSLFSLCDEPIVVSGDSIMKFYWKDGGDQLHVRRGKTPTVDKTGSMSGQPWTSFHVDLRESAPIPSPLDFARFLANSLPFTVHLRRCSFYLDDVLLAQVEKKVAPPRPLSLDHGLRNSSPMKMMTVKSLEQIGLQIDAKVARGLLLSEAKPRSASNSKVLSNLLPTSTAETKTAASNFATKMLLAFSGSSSKQGGPNSTTSTPVSETPPSEPVKDLSETLPSTVFLRMVTAGVSVTVTKHFGMEIERATKKPPPTSTRVSLIFANKDEFDASRDEEGNKVGDKVGGGRGGEGDDVKARTVFDNLMSDLDKQGRIAIGFFTHQTTGFAGSMAAQFIPTVERESLDFQAAHIADFNRELLFVAGYLTRSVYEEEMRDVSRLWKELVPDTASTVVAGKDKRSKQEIEASESSREWLKNRSLHTMRFFTFSSSTPSGVVSSDVGRHFFSVDSQTSRYGGTPKPGLGPTIFSTSGPLASKKVRIAHPELSSFIKKTPTVPEDVAAQSPGMLARLREQNLIQDISLDDVFSELGDRALDLEEMKSCLAWWISLAKNRSYDPSLWNRLRDSAVLSIPASTDVSSGGSTAERIVPLAMIKTFVNPKTITLDLPLPDHCMPYELSKHFKMEDLSGIFQWNELSITEWVTNLFGDELVKGDRVETNVLRNEAMAEKVLGVIARSWQSLPQLRRQQVQQILSDKPIIPTRHGSKMASESYFSNVTLFEDLPVVRMPSGAPVKGSLEKLLADLGVRRHVELQLVFERLLGAGEWSHVELTKYLVSVQGTLSSTEVERLRKTAWLPKDGEAKISQPPGPDGVAKKPKTIRYVASALYEPTEVLRSLGLPIVEWGVKWKSPSEEAKFLFRLGLKRSPSIEEVLSLAADVSNPARRTLALGFFLTQYTIAGFNTSYDTVKHSAYAFVPTASNKFAKPTECYSNPACAVMGFERLSPDFTGDVSKFKLRTDPSSAQLIKSLLAKPPKDQQEAIAVFSYLAARIGEFASSDLSTLKVSAFIPFKDDAGFRHIAPNGCYFKSEKSSLASLFKFNRVDFGPTAKTFLLACGVKDEPTVEEVATMLISDPKRFYDLAGSPEQYLIVLRSLAANAHLLSSYLKNNMKKSPFFLGSKRIARATDDKDPDEDDEDTSVLQFTLAKPSDIVIVDDPSCHMAFRSHILSCAQEDTLEAFAESLGAPRLSRLIKEQYKVSSPLSSTGKIPEQIHALILERTALFLGERKSDRRLEIKKDADWLKKHLKVYEVPKVDLHRTLVYGPQSESYTHVQHASAAAMMESGGNLALYVASNVEVDFFDIASALCKFLLNRQRLNDTLLFMTVLQTPLRSLKRRGFDVDRILNARRIEREATEQRARDEKVQAELDAAKAQSLQRHEDNVQQVLQRFPDAEPNYVREIVAQAKEDPVRHVSKRLANEAYPKRPQPPTPQPGSLGALGKQNNSFFGSFRRRLLDGNRPPEISAGAAHEQPPQIKGFEPPPGLAPDSSQAMGPPRKTSSLPDPKAQVTPTSDIRTNILRAIQASKPDQSQTVSSTMDTKTVKEGESTYCDTSGAAADLSFCAEVSGLRFFISTKVPEPDEVMREFGDALGRFAQQIVKPVGSIFGLDPRCLHIFYDLEGPLIAFNRNGSLYLNLRYYAAWHDALVVAGDLDDALVSCYFSLAHEIAHNLVLPHNSEHEFYFSSLCETYFTRLASYMASLKR